MYEKAAKGWLKHIDFFLWDVFLMQLAYTIAFLIRQGSMPYSQQISLNAAISLFMIQAFMTFFLEPYKNILKRGSFQEGISVIRYMLEIMVLSMALMYITKTSDKFSRLVFFTAFILFSILSLAVRLWWKKYLITRQEKHPTRSLIVITVTSMLPEVRENVKAQHYRSYHRTGIVLMDEDWIGKEIEGLPVIANAQTVLEYVQREWVDEVFLNFPEGSYIPRKLINDFAAMGVTVHQKIAVADVTRGHVQHVEQLGKYTVLTTSINLVTRKEMFMKRGLDILGGLVGCMITLIFIIFIGPAIYIQSPGPIFFSQIRVGMNGRKFKIYKFRSMYMDAEERKKKLMEQNKVSSGLMFKMDDDPRIIGGKKGVGAFIRKFSIDEFPQFFNVLKGDMSLVGTRPPTVDEWEKYEIHHRIRLAIKPGITGMWQANGRSSITDFEEVVRLDQEYIETWSFMLDIKLLLKTVKAVFASDGAQ